MTTHTDSRPLSPARRRPLFGLPLLAIVGLALLAVPRVILHDLGLVAEQTFVNMILVVAPAAIWIAVALIARVPHPFVTLLAVGACYGVFLAVTHQVLWNVAFADVPLALGGNLASLDPAVQVTIMRVFAAISSLFTGLVVGAVTGLIAWGLSAALRRSRA